MTKRAVFAVLLLAMALVAAVAAGCGGEVPGDAVAKVGDAAIQEDAFNARVEEFAAQYGIPDEATDPDTWKMFETQVLEYMVTYQLAAQKAEDYDLSVTDEDVQAEIDTVVETYYQGDQAAFDDELAQMGLTVEKLKANYKESMLLQKVYEKAIADVADPTDADIAAYYEANKDRFYVDETRTARHILIKPGDSEADDSTTTTTAAASTTTTSEYTDADWAAALETATEVHDLLIGGGDWAELATEYSDDAYSASRGGDLGEVTKGQMVPEFEDAVFSLKLNEISEPVKSMYGYHVIQVTEISEARQLPLEEVKDQISATLLQEKQGEAWLKWIEDTKTELGVTYREDMQPTTTVSTEPAATTDGPTDTTAGEEGTTTTAGQTITTSGADTTTTEP